MKKARGGGGGHFHICAYWVCAIFETPIFSPKFSLQSISFSQITEKSAPEHHHFRVFAAPETIIFKISYLQAVSSPPTAGLLRPARTRSGRQALLGYYIAGQNVTRRVLQNQPWRPCTNLTLDPAPETHLFTLKPFQARARDHNFQFNSIHIYFK